MKKIRLLLLLLMFTLLFLTGCTYKGYSGDNSDLYTVAINSVLWNNGHSFSADQYANPQIEIIEEDAYGRTMFMYYEKYYAGADMSFSALIICQSSNGNEVLYYENVNYIIKEQALYTQSLTEFENEEIEQLKAANDWNKEINLDKCIRKEIITKKPTIPYEQEIKDKIIEEFHLISGEYALFVNFLTSDSDNSNFMIYGSIYHNENNGIYFIGFVESDGASFKELNILVPSNPYDYKTELIEFKKANGWG